MTRLIRLMMILALLCFGATAHAQEEESADTELAAVPRVLAKAQYVNKVKPNLKAKIYFVYQSRSACIICVKEAPTLVKEYKRMKRKGCEMVMLNIDKTPEDAEKWVKKAKMTFPVISPSISMSCGMPWPYTGRPLLPCMVAMTPDGTKIGEASGPDVSGFVKSWRKLLRELEKEEAKQAAAEAREKAKAEKAAGKNKKKSRADEEDEEENDSDFTADAF